MNASFDEITRQAVQHMDAGNWGAARTHWLRALDLDTESAEIMLELSYLESLAGRYLAARDWALRAAQARTTSMDAVVSLVRRLRTFNELPPLRKLVEGLLQVPSTPHGVLVECARQLSNLNDFPLALQCAEAAVAKAPGDLIARLVRGQLLAQYARIDEAVRDLHWVLARNPRIAIGWWMLSRLQKQTVESNHLPQLRELARMPDIRPADAAAVARALHKELDDIGNHVSAWHALEQLCTIKRANEHYDPAENRHLFEALLAGPVAEQNREKEHVSHNEKVPIFIVGMHRSGTTLMEQLLDASQLVRALGELSDFTSAMRYSTDYYCKGTIDRVMIERAAKIDFREVGRHYMEGVTWRLGDEPFFTDKQPANFLNIGFICQALPQAKILHMVRDPIETCFSNLRELFTEINPYSYDQAELADYYLQYRRLMIHWHQKFPGRILDVDYAELTRDPDGTMRKVAAFCGIEYVEAMSDPRSSRRAVATASAVQVRDPVVRRTQPKWAPYREHLQPLVDALQSGGVALTDGSV